MARRDGRPARSAALGGGLVLRLDAARGARRPRSLPRPVRPRLADHRAAGAAGSGPTSRVRRCGRWPRCRARRDDPDTDEEPGKILHEYRPRAEPRFAELGWPVRDGGSSTTARRTRRRGSSSCWPRSADAALSAELEPALARRRGVARARAGARRRARPLRAARALRRARAAGLARRGRAGRGARPRRRHPAPRRQRARARRWPTPTCRRSPTRRCARSARCPGRRRGGGAPRRSRRGSSATSAPDVMALEAGDAPVPGAGSQLGWLLWSGALSGERARGARRGG